MDGCSRQNPAYRPATERPRSGGVSPRLGAAVAFRSQLRTVGRARVVGPVKVGALRSRRAPHRLLHSRPHRGVTAATNLEAGDRAAAPVHQGCRRGNATVVTFLVARSAASTR